MAQQISTNEFKQGIKLELDNQPFLIISNEFVKPGKGQSFNRVRLKHLLTGRTIERTFKSGDKADVADVVEAEMRLLYKEGDGVVFMDETSYEQVKIPNSNIGETMAWLKEDLVYGVIFYKGSPVNIDPPIFMELKITETMPGDKGNTASGRVMKPATLETGATVQIPIFINEGEVVKFDTRNGEYVSRASS
jgi:elongation factor P